VLTIELMFIIDQPGIADEKKPRKTVIVILL